MPQNPEAVGAESEVNVAVWRSSEGNSGRNQHADEGSTREQIIPALRQDEGGEKAADICRKPGVSRAFFWMWRKQDAWVGIQELRELRSLREESGRLKPIVADQTLNRQSVAGNHPAAYPVQSLKVLLLDRLRRNEGDAGPAYGFADRSHIVGILLR